MCVSIRINNLFNCASGLEGNFRGGAGVSTIPEREAGG